MGQTIARRAASRRLPLRSASRMATLIKWIHIGMHRQVWPHITFHNTTCTLERWRVAGNRGPAMVCLTGLSARNRSGLRSPKLPTITEWKLMGPLSRMRSMCHLTGLRRSSIHTVSFRGRSGIVLLNLRLIGFDPGCVKTPFLSPKTARNRGRSASTRRSEHIFALSIPESTRAQAWAALSDLNHHTMHITARALHARIANPLHATTC